MTGAEFGWIVDVVLILNWETVVMTGIGIETGIETEIEIEIMTGIVAVTFRPSTVNPVMGNVIGATKG